ncbi:MAG TPA: hypothetical protein VID73_13470, partial [Ktedonobacterales bacterium]
AEDLYNQGLAALRSVGDVAQLATGSLVCGAFLITKRAKPDEGCTLLAEAARLYDQMELAGQAEEARATARRLGCG